jgi:hypothetical protein
MIGPISLGERVVLLGDVGITVKYDRPCIKKIWKAIAPYHETARGARNNRKRQGTEQYRAEDKRHDDAPSQTQTVFRVLTNICGHTDNSLINRHRYLLS